MKSDPKAQDCSLQLQRLLLWLPRLLQPRHQRLLQQQWSPQPRLQFRPRLQCLQRSPSLRLQQEWLQLQWQRPHLRRQRPQWLQQQLCLYRPLQQKKTRGNRR